MGNQVRFKASLDDQVTGKLGKIRDQFDRLGQTGGAKSILQGVGMGVGIALWNNLGNAIGAATDFMGDSIAKAREEQVGIARLNQALASNIEGWDGNRDAIEKVISAREELAFSDGEQRDSLAVLLTRTKNVNKALELQRQAMDLARLKGMDLATASGVIGKVYSGNVGILTRYGIAVRKGSTATEALGQVSAATAGQAEQFAKTTEGAMQSAQIAVENLMEDIGTQLLPVLKEVALVVRNDVVPALRDMVEWMKENQDALDFLGTAAEFFLKGQVGGSYAFVQKEADKARQAAIDASVKTAAAWDTGSERIGMAGGTIAAAMIDIGDASGETKDEIVADNRKITRSYKEISDYLLGQYTENYDTAMGIVEGRADLHNAKTDADRAEAYADLAALGALSAKDYEKWIGTLERLAKGTKGKVHDAYMAAIRDIKALKAAASGSVTFKVTYKAAKPGQAAVPQAMGGPVTANSLYLVGEKGPELFVPKTSGTIVPNKDITDRDPLQLLAPTPTREPDQLLATVPRESASRTPEAVVVHTHLNLDGREIARVVDRHLYYAAARAPRSATAG